MVISWTFKRVFEVKEELESFISCNDKKMNQIFLAKLNDPKWITRLVYIVDIFTPKYFEHIFARIWCCCHWRCWQIEEFSNEAGTVGDKSKERKFWEVWGTCWQAKHIKSDGKNLIVNHLASLQSEMKRHFPDVSAGILKLIRDPFHTDVSSVNDEVLEEFILALWMTQVLVIYFRESLVRFWCRISKSYPQVAEESFRPLILSPSTYYLWETWFSSLLVIKSKLTSSTECGSRP